MKVLVLGSTGFIGSNSIRILKQHDVEVVGADLQNGLELSVSGFAKLFEKSKPDYCLNALGSAAVQPSFKTPYEDFEKNTQVVYQLAEAMRQTGSTARLIQISSAAVYGNPPSLPITETSPVSYISPYGVNKFLSENILLGYARIYGLKALSVRAFSVYGPGAKKQLLWDIAQKVKDPKAQELRLFGQGLETRDFLYVDDLVQLFETLWRQAAFKGETLNAASGVETPVKTVAELLVSELRPGLPIQFSGELKVGDPDNWRADISKATKLGFRPKFDLPTGIKSYVNWLRDEKLV